MSRLKGLLASLFVVVSLSAASEALPYEDPPLAYAIFKPKRHALVLARKEVRQAKCRHARPPKHTAWEIAPERRRGNLRLMVSRYWHSRWLSSRCLPWYISRQIHVATLIGRASAGDPWPNCPDPFDGGGYSWYDTVACENGGSWLDSPGYYRCGLQFDPSWERIYGRLCP